MNLDAAIQAQIDGHMIRVSYLMRLSTDPVVRVWTGIGDIVIGAETFSGVGLMQEVPAIQSVVNGTAQRIDVSISGVDAEVIELIDQDADGIRFSQVEIGMIFMDDDWQPLSDSLWIWDGEADFVSTDSASNPDFNRYRTVTLSIGSLLTGRRRPKLNYFTKVQQRSRSADDAFCDLVSRYSAERAIKWPP